MTTVEELQVITRGIRYLDSLLELYAMTDDTLSPTARDIMDRRENLIHCLHFIGQRDSSYTGVDRRKRG
jgi:hypothetical protein